MSKNDGALRLVRIRGWGQVAEGRVVCTCIVGLGSRTPGLGRVHVTSRDPREDRTELAIV
jgi:hypothetical protein